MLAAATDAVLQHAKPFLIAVSRNASSLIRRDVGRIKPPERQREGSEARERRASRGGVTSLTVCGAGDIFVIHRGAEAEDQTALDLSPNGVGINGRAAIDRHHRAVQHDFARKRDRHLHHA